MNLHTKVSEIENDFGMSCDNTENSSASKRISDTAQERISLTEEPVTKKRKQSKSKEPCLYDTQKSSAVTVVRKSRTSRNIAAKDLNKRNVKGETQLHVACIKVGFIVLLLWGTYYRFSCYSSVASGKC
jgi:hypothetical protein